MLKNNKNPLISVITVVFNGVKEIEQTILSVVNQTFKDFEFIIIDGGSSDGSSDIIKKYENKINYWVFEKEIGLSDTYKKEGKLANFKFFKVINSDDFI